MGREQIYTELAGQAIQLADIFALLVGSTPVPTPGGVFAIELTKPHGPSTGGGVQTLQHITLVHGDLTVVAGTLDQTTHIIELRAYDNVATQYRARWNKALPIERAHFDELVARIRKFAVKQQFVVAIKTHAPEAVERAAAVAGSRGRGVAIGAALVLIAAVIALVLLRVLR